MLLQILLHAYDSYHYSFQLNLVGDITVIEECSPTIPESTVSAFRCQNSSTGVKSLSLLGMNPVSVYQEILQRVMYENGVDEPDLIPRQIEVVWSYSIGSCIPLTVLLNILSAVIGTQRNPVLWTPCFADTSKCSNDLSYFTEFIWLLHERLKVLRYQLETGSKPCQRFDQDAQVFFSVRIEEDQSILVKPSARLQPVSSWYLRTFDRYCACCAIECHVFSLQLFVVDGGDRESNIVTVKVGIIPVNDNPPVIDTDGNSTVFMEEMAAVDIVGQNVTITDQDQVLDHMFISEVQVRILNASSGEVSLGKLCALKNNSILIKHF